MEYREFVCAAIETMNQKEGKNGIQAREHRAVKNNGKIRVGLLLQETGSNLFPTIYLEEYYEKFQKGETLEQIVSEISQSSSLSIQNIACSCGYSNSFSFSKAFRKVNGLSPSEYRKQKKILPK